LKSSGILTLGIAALAAAVLIGLGVTQEVPRGTVTGLVTFGSQNRPLPGATVSVQAMSAQGSTGQEVTEKTWFEATTDADGRFRVNNVPTGVYRVMAYGKAHRAKSTGVLVQEGQEAKLDVKLVADSPRIDLYVSQKVWTPDETPRFETSGFLEEDAVQLSVHRVKPEAIQSAGRIQAVLSPLAYAMFPAGDRLLRQSTERVSTETVSLNQDVEGTFVQPVNLKSLPEGIYWIECRGRSVRRGAYFMVTRIALVTKTAKGRALAYATDIQSGQPMRGVAISRSTPAGMQTLGTTNENGLLQFSEPGANARLFSAKLGSSIAFVDSYIPDGQNETLRAFTYTDRPVYRPGDTIQFKSIVRRRVEDGWVLPGVAQANVVFKDPNGEKIAEQSLGVSQHGTLFGEFSTSAEAAPGFYTLAVTVGGVEQNQSVELAAYRKPEFEVKVTPEKPRIALGQSQGVSITCSYYFGGPVAGARVQGYITRSPRWETWDDEFDPVDEPYSGGEIVQEFEGVTNEAGELKLVAQTSDAEGEAWAGSYTYSVNASVTENDQRFYDGSGSFAVTRGNIRIEFGEGSPFGSPGQAFPAAIRLTDYESGKPVATPAVTFELVRETYKKDQVDRSVVAQASAQADSTGSAEASLVPAVPGSYVVRALVKGPDGLLSVAERSLWVDGASDGAGPQGRLTVVVDNPKANAGGTVRAMIQTDRPGGTAVVALESDRIYWAQTVPLNTNTTFFDVPVPAESAPNAAISAVYVKDKQFMQAGRNVSVARTDRKLQVEIQADMATAFPKATVTYTITTKDESGNPVSADVSLGVVDESVYAIRSDRFDLVQEMYPRRWNQVNTSYSFPEIYLDGGDKGTGTVPIRRIFRDTAGWNANLRTGQDGQVTAVIALPENLTTWRATAIAVTDDSRAGKATHLIQSRKDLMVRIQAPTFLSRGDRQAFTVTVTNANNQSQPVQMSVRSQGAELLGKSPAREGRVPDESFRQEFTLGAGESRPIELGLQANREGTVDLYATATAGSSSDGVTVKVPVREFGTESVNNWAGDTVNRETIPLLRGAGSTGTVTVEVAPTIAGTVLNSLDELIDFPYGCVEQTMSRFLPAVLADRTFRELGLPPTTRAAQIPKIVEDGYARLGRMQQPGGAWGWWEYGDSNPFMTALVLDGVAEAAAAGYSARFIRLNDALNAAESMAKAPESALTPNDATYLAYALARHGRSPGAKSALARADTAQLNATGLSYAALTSRLLGDPARAESLMDRCLGLAVKSGQDVYWTSDDTWGAEPTAIALNALVTIRPGDPHVSRAVRHLMRTRRGRMWFSTRDTAAALRSLLMVLKSTGELAQNGAITVRLNGKPIVQEAVSPGQFGSRLAEIPLADVPEGANELAIEATGGVRAYYSVSARQVSPAEDVAPQPKPGFTIRRDYFLLRTQRTADGRMRLLPTAQPVNSARSGELVRCVITVNSERPRAYVMIQDYFVSNGRITEREDPGLGEEWGWWYDRLVIRDDRIAFFATSLPKGESTFTYTFRAESPGKSRAMPATIENMYDPDDRAAAGSAVFEVSP
jgi:uncharacterized protein YfaS (alpha-2-macroglobulin family)